jgi:hypothetical protein
MPAAYWAIDRRHGSQLHRWGLGYVVEVWLVKLVRVILAEITPSDLPFVVGFGQQGADPAQDSGSIRKTSIGLAPKQSGTMVVFSRRQRAWRGR